MDKNIVYKTDQIAEYFAHNRVTWKQFYKSEQVIIESLNLNNKNSILDIGCGCGGLGLALKEKFGVVNYTGVEINSLAAKVAITMNQSAKIHCGDFLDLSQTNMRSNYYDTVFSLSCFDWNIQFEKMLNASWKHVAEEGHLVITLRLVPGLGCDDISKSYQYINFNGKMEGECASYVVLNANELLSKIISLNPSAISAFGYYGSPSLTAVTPFKEICFCAFSIKKRKPGNQEKILFNIDIPESIKSTLNSLH